MAYVNKSAMVEAAAKEIEGILCRLEQETGVAVTGLSISTSATRTLAEATDRTIASVEIEILMPPAPYKWRRLGV